MTPFWINLQQPLRQCRLNPLPDRLEAAELSAITGWAQANTPGTSRTDGGEDHQPELEAVLASTRAVQVSGRAAGDGGTDEAVGLALQRSQLGGAKGMPLVSRACLWIVGDGVASCNRSAVPP